MLTGDLKDQNIRIVVGVPMYGGMLSESTFHSLLALHQWCLTQRGLACQLLEVV